MNGSLVKFSLAVVMVLLWLAPSFCQSGQSTDEAAAFKAAMAKPTPRTADGHPNLAGYWESFPGNATAQRGYTGTDGVTYSAFVPKPGAERPSASAQTRPAPNVPPYKPEYLEKVKQLAAHAEDRESKDPSFYCKPLGVPRIGHPRQIVETPGLIIFLYQVDSGEGAASGNAVRLIPLDGRPHRKDVDPMYFGDSVGRWEGDTLVVDVTHLTDDTWMDGRGTIHSTALHVVERITRQGDTLRWEATAEDPNFLTKPWALTPQESMLTNDMVIEQPPCEERDQASGALQTEGKK